MKNPDIGKSTYGHLKLNNPDTKFLKIKDKEIDTISIDGLLPYKGFSLICVSEKWCQPSYSVFNTLYNDNIIEFLKNNDTRLIIVTNKYPFTKVNNLDSLARYNIESDFEIYYSANRLESHTKSLPQIWLIDYLKRIIFHSDGTKEDYSNLKKNIMKYKIHHICPHCNGTGRVEPNRRGGIDSSVGMCNWCGGSGRR